MKFEDKFTTKAKKDADTSPEKIESKKVELSPDGFAHGLMIERQTIMLSNVIRSLMK